MNSRYLIIYLTLATLAQLTQSARAQNGDGKSSAAQIGVYFESRCPDSRRFFLDQLVPAYRKLGNMIEPTLVPFGHARTLGQNKMICQHGPKECQGNRLMACILARSANVSATIETIGCMFAYQQTNKECVQTNLPGVSFDELESCTNSDESYQLMVKYEEMTGRLDYVPHLTYNNQSSEEIQNECENNLKNFVCKNHKGQKPASCN